MSQVLSLARKRADRRRDEQFGFSLIELMVVLLIIAILLAVAIPTYLAARNRAENRAAQETLQNVFTAAKADYASQNAFVPLGGAASMHSYLSAQSPGVKVVGPTTTFSKVNVVGEENGPQHILLGDWAPDGKCFYLLDAESTASEAITSGAVAAPGTYYKEGSDSGGCTAYKNFSNEVWQTSWAAAAANY